MELILFGAGHYGQEALSFFGAEGVFCFCDNSVKKGEEKEVCGKRVVSFAALQEICQDYIVVLCIKLEFSLEICRQMEEAGIIDYVVFEMLRSEGKSANEWMERLQDREERSNIQRQSYLFLLDKAMAQLKYLKHHSEITALKPAEGKLREYQFRLIERGKEFFRFVEELSIKPFLVFGNLIGAFRHRGFVPWDDDLDFGLVRDDYERLLAFAYEKCVVLTYEPEEDVWVDLEGNTIRNDMLCQTYPGRYILNHRPEFIQVSKCMETTNEYIMDLWGFDFYKAEYDFKDYKKWAAGVSKVAGEKKTRREQMLFIREAQRNNPMISSEMTDHFYPGIDNFFGKNRDSDIDDWIMSEDIFPLREVAYENTTFLAPRNMEVLLRREYADYMEFPDEVGMLVHGEGAAI